MLYQEYKKLDCTLHDNQFLSEMKNGVFNYVYKMTASDTFFTDEIYTPLKKEFLMDKNTYFALENFCKNGILLQRITFMEKNESYIRTGSKLTNNGSDFVGFKFLNGITFSDWVVDSIKENDKEVQDVLQSASKDSMRERLLSRQEPTYKDIFFYKRRLTLGELTNPTLVTGFYSFIDNFSNFGTITYFNNTILERRASVYKRELVNRDYYDLPNDRKVEGVLENYNTDNFIFQALYISHPIVINLNRVYVKSENRWTIWRFNQNVDDMFWHLNSIPTNKYNIYPTYGKTLKIDTERIRANVYGQYYDDKAISDAKILSQDKNAAYKMSMNSLYNLKPDNLSDYVYGYAGRQNVRVLENGTEEDKKWLINNTTPYSNFKWTDSKLDFSGYGRTIYNQYNEEYFTSQNNSNNFAQRSLLGYSKNENEFTGTKKNEYFRYINGISLYWSSDILYMDIMVNKVIQDKKLISEEGL